MKLQRKHTQILEKIKKYAPVEVLEDHIIITLNDWGYTIRKHAPKAKKYTQWEVFAWSKFPSDHTFLKVCNTLEDALRYVLSQIIMGGE